MKKYKIKIKGILEKSFYFIAESEIEAENKALKIFKNKCEEMELEDYYVIESEEINF